MWEFFASVFFMICFCYFFVIFVDPNSTGVLGKMRIFIFETLPALLKRIATMLCGARFANGTTSIWTFLCFKKNPFGQLFYLLCSAGSLFVYISVGFKKYIPGLFLAEYHRYVGLALMILAYLSFIYISNSNPGEITKKNHETAMKRFKFDEVMYFKEGPECKTCKFAKPARSKHC